MSNTRISRPGAARIVPDLDAEMIHEWQFVHLVDECAAYFGADWFGAADLVDATAHGPLSAIVTMEVAKRVNPLLSVVTRGQLIRLEDWLDSLCGFDFQGRVLIAHSSEPMWRVATPNRSS